MHLHYGMRVRYKGEIYCVTNLGSWGVRIEQLPDTVLVVPASELTAA